MTAIEAIQGIKQKYLSGELTYLVSLRAIQALGFTYERAKETLRRAVEEDDVGSQTNGSKK